VWRERTKTVLAVNANFYGSLANNGADIIGLSMTDGVTVSPVRTFGGEPDPAIVFREDGTASAGRFATADLAGVIDAVAGVGGSTTDNDPGTLLVTERGEHGATARVQPNVRNPRTAAGVSEDGTKLILAVIDGRQPGWSDGVTLPELADLMIQHGAHRDQSRRWRVDVVRLRRRRDDAREPPQRRGAPGGGEPPGRPHQPRAEPDPGGRPPTDPRGLAAVRPATQQPRIDHGAIRGGGRAGPVP
jgi:hypothetical protein